MSELYRQIRKQLHYLINYLSSVVSSSLMLVRPIRIYSEQHTIVLMRVVWSHRRVVIPYRNYSATEI
jgi:hypothetical protein